MAIAVEVHHREFRGSSQCDPLRSAEIPDLRQSGGHILPDYVGMPVVIKVLEAERALVGVVYRRLQTAVHLGRQLHVDSCTGVGTGDGTHALRRSRGSAEEDIGATRRSADGQLVLGGAANWIPREVRQAFRKNRSRRWSDRLARRNREQVDRRCHCLNRGRELRNWPAACVRGKLRTEAAQRGGGYAWRSRASIKRRVNIE